MLRGTLIHPEILATLGIAGHGAKVLIADGNYPFSTTKGPNARLVALNLAPGIVRVTDVLDALLGSIVVESAAVMDHRDGLAADPPVWSDYAGLLRDAGFDRDLHRIERFAFYDVARSEDVALVVATGDERVYANLLLTIGVVSPPPAA